MKDVVFYSKNKKDTHSPKLLQLLDLLPFKEELSFFCVDPDPKTKKRNTQLLDILEIEEVPTIIIQGTMMIGEDAFRWANMQLRAVMDEQYGPGEQEQEEQEEEEEEYPQLDTFDPVSSVGPIPPRGATGAAMGPPPSEGLPRPEQTKTKGQADDWERRIEEYKKSRDKDTTSRPRRFR